MRTSFPAGRHGHARLRPRARLRRPHARARMNGFTLLEVLIAILVFSFGVLGAVGMQARMLQASVQNTDRSRAALLANEIVSQMWGQQSVTLSPSVVTAWQARVSDPTVSGLPSGSGSVAVATANGLGTATVTITWRPTSKASADTANQFVTTVVMP